MEKVKNFYEALQADKAMQERANQINEQYKGKDSAAKDENAVTACAISDDELDAVSGGSRPAPSGG